MNRKILIAVAIVGALVVAGLSTEVSAACSTTKQFGQCYFGGSGCTTLVFPADTNTSLSGGVLKGRWWQSGARASHNEGVGTAEPCDPISWIESDGSDGALRMFGFMNGDIYGSLCAGIGCPSNNLIALVQTLSNDGSKSYYAVGKAVGTDEWDFAAGSGINWTLTETPRPRVTNSSRSGNDVSVNLLFDPPAGARGESHGFAPETILTGYQVVKFEGTGDPGRDPALWTNVGAVVPVTNTGAVLAGVVVTCSGTTNDVFLATRPVYDAGQFSGDYVSASTRIECDPTLADPRFKNIDKSKSGRGTTRPN